MRSRTTGSSSRAVSEMLGVAVLIGMTLLVTAALGMGVMLISQSEEKQSADISFTHLSDRVVINYQDSADRPAGSLYVDGPNNNLTWAELSDDLAPEDMVTQDTFVEVGPKTAYGSAVGEEETFDVVYSTEAGKRFVLATWNPVEEDESPAGPDGPTSPDGPGGPSGPGSSDGPGGPSGP